jgi:preprotein translocase subunit SecA
MFQLTPQQHQVIDALSHGATMTDAAAQAGIHRKTIGNWRASDDFREALASAHYDRAALYRDRAVDLADLAFEAIRKVLTDPKSSPSVLLRAATLIIEKVTTPPQFREEKPADITGMLAAMDAADRMHFAQQREQPAAAQECTTAPNDAQPAPIFQMPNSAQPQEPYRRSESKIGRNEPCPCGSGRKYKHCCLNKPLAATA